MTTSRRTFLLQSVTGALSLGAVRSSAQQPVPSNLGPMDENSYRPVSRASKGTAPVINEDQRNELEHRVRCQCGCTLDVYTCRTTDFSCPVSPAMHRDIMGLVAGGYSSSEIIAAFRSAYGEKVLMAPAREGFNWVGYFLPFVAIGVGAAVLIRYIRNRAAGPVAANSPSHDPKGSPEELERLRAAIRDDS